MNAYSQPLQKPIGMIDQLANVMREEIRADFVVGRKLEPLRALAARFHVSPTTLRQALVLLVREGSLQARQGAGYFVAERTTTQHVGILLELDLAMPTVSRFWPLVMQRVRHGLREAGVRCRLYAGDQRPGENECLPCQDFLEDLEEDRLSGLVVIFGTLTPEIAETLRRRSVPMVGNCRNYPYNVCLDYAGLVSEATRRLLAEGRRKLAFMEWCPMPDPKPRSDLFNAFTRQLALHGATLNERWVRHDLHPHAIGAGWEEFREIWMSDLEKPDGLIVADDMLCQGAMQAIQELGIRVPEQLSIVTHGNKDSGVKYPFSVPVLECDPDAYAQAMVELMVGQLRHEPLEQSQINIPFRWAVGGGAEENKRDAKEFLVKIN